MDFEVQHHIYALIGSLIMLIWVMKQAKQARDEGKIKSLKSWFSKNWDDLIWILFIAQGLTFVQEYLFGLYVSSTGDENNWDIYIDNSEAIAFFVGLFGTMLFQKILKLGTRRIDSTKL